MKKLPAATRPALAMAPPPGPRGRLRVLAFVAALGLAPGWAFAQGATEAAVKAAFLFRFAAYVEWPLKSAPEEGAPFVFAIAAANDVATELEKLLSGRAVNHRRAVVRRIRNGESLAGSHLLFVGGSHPGVRTLVRDAYEHGVLPVTEAPGGLESGSVINFVVAENRVGFEVSLEAAERSGHRISSRMLAVARRVVPRS